MDTRYQHPMVTDRWSRLTQYQIWTRIEAAVARVQAESDAIPGPIGLQLADALDAIVEQLRDAPTGDYSTGLIDAHGEAAGHDVAGFIRWAYDRLPTICRDYIHFGLTSSDIVDTALAWRFDQMLEIVDTALDELTAALEGAADEHKQTFMVGRTHSQPAEPTTLGLRMHQWAARVGHAAHGLASAHYEMTVVKLSGPVGTYAHNAPGIELGVAQLLGLRANDLESVTQVRPRFWLSAWADAAAAVVAACSAIATDFRLMAARGEVYEGGVDHRVGSSSMPHKRNPINAEQINGLNRMAQGYAQMLRAVELWEDRDISNSCVERVAVPDLMHVLLTALDRTTALIDTADWRPAVMADALAGCGNAPYSAWKVLQLVDGGDTRFAAETQVKVWAACDTPAIRPTPDKMLANHPLHSYERPLSFTITPGPALDNETKGQVG